MRKNFGVKPMVYPMPVFIIGTYGEIGKVVGKAFSDGLKFK